MILELLSSIFSYYKSVSSAITWYVILQILVVYFVSWIIYSNFIKVYFSRLRYLPSVPYVPFIGNVHDIMKMEPGIFFESWMNKLNASVFRFYWIYGCEKVCVVDADVVKAITVTKSKSYGKPPEDYRLLKVFLGDGFVTSEKLVHQKNRKLCNGSFKVNALLDMLPIFRKCSRELINMWQKEMKTSKKDNQGYIEISIHNEMTNITFDAIGKCAFDYDFNAIKHDNSETTELFKSLVGGFKLTWQRVLPELFPFLWNFKTPTMKKFQNDIKKMNEVVYSVITRMREELKDVENESTDENDNKGKSLLATLMKAKDEDTGMSMNDLQLRDEVITFMLAGHETTAVSLTWCLFQMARYPEIQSKVREEVMAIIHSDDEEITHDHLEQLVYMHCVINETMRLYPAVMLVGRDAREDNYIKDYFFPKGTTVNIHISALHRNPKYWDNPLEFRPERFEDPSKIYPYSFVPFISGSRMCIGYKFALMEMKMILATLIRKFEFVPIPGIEYKRKVTITSRPDPILYLKVKELKRSSEKA